MLYADEKAVKLARANAIRLARSGKIVYNNGIKNKYFSLDDEIPDGWVPGMAPQKKRNPGLQVGCIMMVLKTIESKQEIMLIQHGG